jgi:putative DNA primase/helicase
MMFSATLETGTRQEAALRLAENGYRVFPLVPGAKVPCTPNGVKDATTGAARIAEWWDTWPEANIGLSTEGLIVIDLDGPDNNFPNDPDKLSDFIGVSCQRTGRGGKHYVFKRPEGRTLKNSVGKLAPKVDVRTDGGYIVSAPSVVDGNAYQWLVELPPKEDLPFPPKWLLESLEQADAPEKIGETRPRPTPGEIIPNGQRNDKLFREAASLRARGHTEAEIKALLQQMNRDRCIPALPESEVDRIAESAGRYPEGPTGEPKAFALTDLGNAHRMRHRHGANLRYCHPFKSWLHFNGAVWPTDQTGLIYRLASDTARAIDDEVSQCGDDDQRKRLRQHATRTESERGLKAMVTLLQSLEGIPVLPSDLDANPWIINTPSGTVDLKGGKCSEHRREDLCTRITNAPFDPEADCPTWRAFLARCTGGDETLEAYLQKAVGYSLTGDRSEQVLFFLHGPPAAGKSTFLDVIEWVLGTYATHTAFNVFLEGIGDKPTHEIARLDGARFVSASETKSGRKWDEGLINSVTGDARITARHLYQEAFDFTPVFTLWLGANDKPRTLDGEGGIWRRLKVIPFTQSIPLEERDGDLLEKLKAEGAGILRWAVEGCLAWQELRSRGVMGLDEPEAVTEQTRGYRQEMDTVEDFIADCCATVREASVTTANLYAAYTAWCDEVDRSALSKVALGHRLGAMGFRPGKVNRAKGWHGIGLRE